MKFFLKRATKPVVFVSTNGLCKILLKMDEGALKTKFS